LRRVEQDVRALIEGRLDGADLSFAQWIALKLVADGVAANAGGLSRDLNITSGATTRLIDNLEERGLLTRDRGAEDRRVVRLKLTDAGDAAMVAMAPTVVGAWNELIADFSEEELRLLITLLGRVLTKAETLLGKSHTHLGMPDAPNQEIAA
jgi:DNA-binding MarR family transcriptional regulator